MAVPHHAAYAFQRRYFRLILQAVFAVLLSRRMMLASRPASCVRMPETAHACATLPVSRPARHLGCAHSPLPIGVHLCSSVATLVWLRPKAAPCPRRLCGRSLLPRASRPILRVPSCALVNNLVTASRPIRAICEIRGQYYLSPIRPWRLGVLAFISCLSPCPQCPPWCNLCVLRASAVNPSPFPTSAFCLPSSAFRLLPSDF